MMKNVVVSLDDNNWFPNPVEFFGMIMEELKAHVKKYGDDCDFYQNYDCFRYGNGCDVVIAVGGDLSAERLVLAYSHGIFPWFSFREKKEIEWHCPICRFVIFPDEIHVSHSMRNLMNKNEYRVTYDQDFEGVIRNCSQLRINELGAWLGPDMVAAYTKLHELGYAKSVEVWKDGNLVGGLYGVSLGRCFFGESMFSLAPSASKMALIGLANRMKENGGLMIDCQFETPHLKSMGGRTIMYDEYMEYVNAK